MRVISVVGVFAALGAPAAAQAGWSSTKVLAPKCDTGKNGINCSPEPAPRIAVNRRGQSAAAWLDNKGVVRAASGGKTVGLDTRGNRPGAAIASNGTATIVWSHAGELRYVRRSTGHNFTKPKRLIVRGSKQGDDTPKLAVQSDGAVVVVYENAYRDSKGKYTTRLRSVTLSRSGKVSAVKELGLGSLGHDTFRSNASGHVAVCCLADPNPIEPGAQTLVAVTPRVPIAVYSPGSGWSTVTAPLANGDSIETVAPGTRDTVLGVTNVKLGGESNSFGIPQLFRADSQGAFFGPPLAGPVTNEKKSFGPVVAIDGSRRNVMLYLEKTGVSAFESSAPVYAVTGAAGAAFGPKQTLEPSSGYEPAVAPLSVGAIAAWFAPKNKWGIALERDGTFKKVTSPTGLGPDNVGEDFNYNHDMATNGHYVALAWTAKDSSIRMAVGKF